MAALIALASSVLIVLFLAVQSGPGKRIIVSQVNTFASRSPNFALELERLTGFLPFTAAVDRIRLHDATGPWLEVEGIQLAWAPFSLVRGRVYVRSLQVDSVRMLRLPEGGAPKEPSDDPFSLRAFLDTIERLPQLQIDRLDVARVAIDEAVYGHASSHRLESSAAPDAQGNRHIFARLTTSDGPALHAELEALLDGDDARLDIDVRYAEDPGGLLATALRLEGSEGIAITLQGTGPLSGWTGRCEAAIGDTPMTRIDISLDALDAYAIGASGWVSLPTALVAENLQPLLAEPIEFAAHAHTDLAVTTADYTLTIDAEMANIDSEGRFTRASDHLHARASAELPDLSQLNEALQTGLAGAAVLNLTVDGPIAGPAGSIDVTGSSLRIDDTQADTVALNAQFALHGIGTDSPTVQTRGSGVITGLRVPDRTLPEGDFVQLTFQVDYPDRDTLAFDVPMTLPAYDVSLRIDGTLRARRELDARMVLEPFSVAELAPLIRGPQADTPPVELTGTLGGMVEASGDVGSGDLNGTIALNGTDLAGLPGALLAVVGSTTALTAAWSIEDRQLVNVSALRLESGLLTMHADVEYGIESREVSAQWNAALDDLAALSAIAANDLGGRLQTGGRVQGTLDALNVRAEAQVTGGRVNNRAFEQAILQVDADGLPASPTGTFAIEAASGTDSLRAAARFASDAERVRLSEATFTAPGLNGTAQVALLREGNLLTGRIDADGSDLGAFGGFLGIALSGAARVSAEFMAEDGQQSVVVNGNVLELQSGGAFVASGKVDARAGDLFGQPTLNAAVGIESAEFGAVALDTLSAAVEGGPVDFIVRIDADGTSPFAFALNLEAGAERLPDSERVTIRTLTARLEEHNLRLTQPAVIRRDQDAISLTNFTLGIEGGSLEASAHSTPDAVTAELLLHQAPLRLVDLAGLTPLRGHANGALRLSGPPDAPILEGWVSFDEAAPEAVEMDPTPAFDGAIEMRIADGLLTARASVSGLSDSDSQMEMQAPVALSVRPFAVDVDSDAPLSGSGAFDVDLARFAAFVLPDPHVIQGHAHADLVLDGSFAAPAFRGTLGIDGGRYENIDSGTILSDMTMAAAFREKGFEITQFTAGDGATGTIEITGEVNMLDGLTYAAEASVQQATLIRMEIVEATGNGTIRINGTADEGHIEGELRLSPARINIPRPPPPTVPALDVREVNRPEGQRPIAPPAEPRSEPYPLHLNVTVDMPRQVFVRGRGLDSEWRGRIDIAGTADAPRVRGDLSVIDGDFLFMDRRFELADSRVILNEADPGDPTLNITATLREREILAILRIVGPASSPRITLQSEPPYPEDQVLAYVLFGRPINQLSPGQAIELARAARTLSGGNQSAFDMMGQTRTALGLDTLTFDPGIGTGGMTIGIGKNILDRIYFELRRGITDESTGATARLNITDNVMVEGDFDTQRESGLKLLYRLDY